MKKLIWVATLCLPSAVGLLGLTACSSDDPTYTVCDSSSECESDESCWEVDTTDFVVDPADATFGALCTNMCDADLDCENSAGFGGVCIATDVGATTPRCYQACVEDRDCLSQTVCVDFTEPGSGVETAICLPNNG